MRKCDTLGRVCTLEDDNSLVARLGGDEFVFLLSDIERPEDASLVAQRVLSVLEAPFVPDGQEVYVTVSIGTAVSLFDGAVWMS